MAEVGILKPPDRIELIHGEINTKSPISSGHAGVVNRLYKIFNDLFNVNAFISIQNPVQVDDDNEPEPDIAILKSRSDSYIKEHPKPEDVQVIIEVSGSSYDLDSETKSALYASAGIPTYW